MSKAELFEILSKLENARAFLDIYYNFEVYTIQRLTEILKDKKTEELNITETLKTAKRLLQKRKTPEATKLIESIIVDLKQKLYNENCGNWDNLLDTENDNCKYCHICKKNVYKVSNNEDLNKRRQNRQCIKVDSDKLKGTPVILADKNACIVNENLKTTSHKGVITYWAIDGYANEYKALNFLKTLIELNELRKYYPVDKAIESIHPRHHKYIYNCISRKNYGLLSIYLDEALYFITKIEWYGLSSFSYSSYGESTEKYGGYNGFSDDVIDDAFEGDPSATWNVD